MSAITQANTGNPLRLRITDTMKKMAEIRKGEQSVYRVKVKCFDYAWQV